MRAAAEADPLFRRWWDGGVKDLMPRAERWDRRECGPHSRAAAPIGGPRQAPGLEDLDVDVVLYSTAGPGVTPDDGRFAHQVSALAGMTSCWISYAAPAQLQAAAASGVAAPDGTWGDPRCRRRVARCRPGRPGLWSRPACACLAPNRTCSIGDRHLKPTRVTQRLVLLHVTRVLSADVAAQRPGFPVGDPERDDVRIAAWADDEAAAEDGDPTGVPGW